MLTADLVRVRKKGGVLSVVELNPKSRKRALELATLYLELGRDQVGGNLGALKEAWSAVEVGPREKKLADGLLKLIEDDSEFLAESPIEPQKLRGEVFLLAAAARKASTKESPWDRRPLLAEVAAKYGVEPSAIDAALYSDLRSQAVLQAFSKLNPEQLIERYELAQYQAVLLRASRVTATVRFPNAADYRRLFRALKFRRLLYTIKKEGSGYQIHIDGPFSLFDSVTKYGLQLALVFPALLCASHLELQAQLRWGKTREELVFNYDHKRARAEASAADSLPDEVDALLAAFKKLKTPWVASVNDQVLDLPGVGVVIPDLVFTQGKHRIYLEVLGFWSRDAVWKRVELVEAGLPHRLLFAVSQRLRVSEAALPDDAPSSLVVYKGTLSARAVLTKLDNLAAR